MNVIITISSRRISRRCTVHSLDHPKTLNLLQFPDTVLPWEKNGMVQQTQFTTEGVVTGYDGGWVFSNAVDNSGVQPATRPNHRPATGNQWNGKATAIRNEGVVTVYTGEGSMQLLRMTLVLFNLPGDQITVLPWARNGMVKRPQSEMKKEYSLPTQVHVSMSMLTMSCVVHTDRRPNYRPPRTFSDYNELS